MHESQKITILALKAVDIAVDKMQAMPKLIVGDCYKIDLEIAEQLISMKSAAISVDPAKGTWFPKIVEGGKNEWVLIVPKT
jgi:hypothetical protein